MVNELHAVVEEVGGEPFSVEPYELRRISGKRSAKAFRRRELATLAGAPACAKMETSQRSALQDARR